MIGMGVYVCVAERSVSRQTRSLTIGTGACVRGVESGAMRPMTGIDANAHVAERGETKPMIGTGANAHIAGQREITIGTDANVGVAE